MTLVLVWNDSRLITNKQSPDSFHIPIGFDYHHCYWQPIFDAVELKSMVRPVEVMVRPKLLDQKNGLIMTVTKYIFVVACSMDLQLYPMDIQQCNITFQSLKMANFSLMFRRNYDRSTKELSTDITYDLISIKRYIVDDSRRRSYLSSKLTISFIFKRRLPLYVMTTYFPSALVTIVSFTSFWIHPEAVPGRITLGVTCLLALITQMVSVRDRINKVNYVTTIDVWFLGCITFVALSLFEFALSYTLYRNKCPVNYMAVNAGHPENILTKIYRKSLRLSVDQWSRILFLVVFILFKCVYFTTLFVLTSNRESFFQLELN